MYCNFLDLYPLSASTRMVPYTKSLACLTLLLIVGSPSMASNASAGYVEGSKISLAQGR